MAESVDKTAKGWYKDPEGLADERYYNGRIWTEFTRRTATIDGNVIVRELMAIKKRIVQGSIAIVLAITLPALILALSLLDAWLKA